MSTERVTFNNCEYGDYEAAVYALKRFQLGLKYEGWPGPSAIISHTYRKPRLGLVKTVLIHSYFFVSKTRAGNWSVTRGRTTLGIKE